MPIERTHFVVKFPEDAPSSLLSLFPSPNGKYVSVRATNPKQNISMPVNTVLYPHNGQYVPVQWKVHNDFTFIQLYWWPQTRYITHTASPTTQLRSGKEIYIIRTLFRTLFWCLIKFKLSLNRARIRLLIKKAMSHNSISNKLSVFSGNVNYPIQSRILNCI